MTRLVLLLGFAFLCVKTTAQETYFPPLDGDEWETLSPDSLHWCPEQIDSLYTFLEEKNSRAFIVLYRGKVVLENYFNGAVQDDPWYWASAGKTLAAFLVGCAQADGDLSIDQPTSDYLGEGWTSCPPEKEALITVRDQIAMTTGLEYDVEDLNCQDPSCLTYSADAGEEWYYYNAPYRLVQSVLENATGTDLNLYTAQRLGNAIGMGGLWIDHVRWSKARDMARFGLLMASDGVWAGNTVLDDLEYINAMRTPSQELNPSYGYLWWLNGQDEMMLPSLDIQLPGPLVADAPADVYAALGKNDQKIYIAPSLDLVIVRQGDTAGEPAAGPSSFDTQLWQRINALECTVGVAEEMSEKPMLYPNPVNDRLFLKHTHGKKAMIYTSMGEMVEESILEGNSISIAHLNPGLYFLGMDGQQERFRFIKE